MGVVYRLPAVGAEIALPVQRTRRCEPVPPVELDAPDLSSLGAILCVRSSSSDQSTAERCGDGIVAVPELREAPRFTGRREPFPSPERRDDAHRRDSRGVPRKPAPRVRSAADSVTHFDSCEELKQPPSHLRIHDVNRKLELHPRLAAVFGKRCALDCDAVHAFEPVYREFAKRHPGFERNDPLPQPPPLPRLE